MDGRMDGQMDAWMDGWIHVVKQGTALWASVLVTNSNSLTLDPISELHHILHNRIKSWDVRMQALRASVALVVNRINEVTGTGQLYANI